MRRRIRSTGHFEMDEREHPLSHGLEPREVGLRHRRHAQGARSMKTLFWSIFLGLVFWLSPVMWWVFNLVWQARPFCAVIVALGVLIICAGIAFGTVKLLDRLYRIWAGVGMNKL